MQLQLVREEQNKTITETIDFEDENLKIRIRDDYKGGRFYYFLEKVDFERLCESKRNERFERTKKERKTKEEAEKKRQDEIAIAKERSRKFEEIEKDLPEFNRWKAEISGKNFIQQVLALWKTRK